MKYNDIEYYMPPEWYPQEAVWLTWPQNSETFGDYLELAQNAILKAISAIIDHQKINLLVNPEMEPVSIIQDLLELYPTAQNYISNLLIFETQVQDIWIRDYGPTFLIPKPNIQMNSGNITKTESLMGVKSGEYHLLNWKFNAWGEKYSELIEDTEIPQYIASQMKYQQSPIDFVLEGGSIDINGLGDILTTKQCLLNTKRNPKYSQNEIEQILINNLGAKQILWLDKGIEGDDTDGHIDDIARWVDNKTVVMVIEENEQDPNYWILKQNFELLQKMKNSDGDSIEIESLPMPDPVKLDDTRLPASYANFLITTKKVLLPVFGVKQDEEAIRILTKLFPGRQIVPINCRYLVYGLGTLHCCSQQQPALILRNK